MTTDHTRRAFLRGAGIVGGAVALAGCGQRPTEPTPEPTESRETPAVPTFLDDVADRWEFDDVVNLASKGADTRGRRAIDDALESAVSDDTLLYLPKGRYRLREEFDFLEFDRFGIVGDGATVVPAEGFDQTLLGLGDPDEAGELFVSGLTFDFRADSTGGRPIVARVADRLLVRDVTVRGRQDVENDLVRIDVGSPEGSGRVERLRLPDGGVPGAFDGDEGITGCEVGGDTRGDVTFVDCHIEGFPDNGLYADPPAGTVRVVGGYYANNGVASVRVNGGAGSVVRNVHVRCDETRRGVENMRGIRLRGGDAPVVENCLVEMERVTSSDGAITLHSELAAGTVQNCRIRVDADGVPAIRVKSPDVGVAADGPIRIRDVEIEGGAADDATVDISDRDDCRIERACIRQTGRNRDGILTQHVGGQVTDSLIAVRGRPMAFEDSKIATSKVTVDRNPNRLSADARDRCRGIRKRD